MKKSKKSYKKTSSESEDPLDRDMSEFMLQGLREGKWRRVHFELTKKKNKTVTMRMSDDLLSGIKAWAADLGLTYQKLIRVILESSLRKKDF